MKEYLAKDFVVNTLGDLPYETPAEIEWFVGENERFLLETNPELLEKQKKEGKEFITIERAGPRKKIHFNPDTSKAAIVTCGGLCPGINNVIYSITCELIYQYKLNSVVGYRFGYQGLIDPEDPVPLTTENVFKIAQMGGSALSSSRGHQDVSQMVDRLVKDNINLLFLIGGDGTLRGGQHIYEEVTKRGLDIAVVAVPKTIDNDLNFISKSFGFETAYGKAVEALECAHTEATGAPNGVGLVKVMGRHSGSIACHATVASRFANFCLIPEVPFALEGPDGLFEVLKKRLLRRLHAVIVVAEGAGQHLMPATGKTDASGNIKMEDIGIWLRDQISDRFKKDGFPINLKYIDPSYIIRAVPAEPSDALFCTFLGQYAVHAAMSGRTAVVIGQWNSKWAHLPISLVTADRKQVDPAGTVWRAVLETTGQKLAQI